MKLLQKTARVFPSNGMPTTRWGTHVSVITRSGQAITAPRLLLTLSREENSRGYTYAR